MYESNNANLDDMCCTGMLGMWLTRFLECGLRKAHKMNTKLIGIEFHHLLRNPASINAMKQICVIVIRAYFTLFQL